MSSERALFLSYSLWSRFHCRRDTSGAGYISIRLPRRAGQSSVASDLPVHGFPKPVFDCVGVLVHSPQKVDQDAGDLVGIVPTGVVTTGDVEAEIALDAVHVLYIQRCRKSSTFSTTLRLAQIHPTENEFVLTPTILGLDAQSTQMTADGSGALNTVTTA